MENPLDSGNMAWMLVASAMVLFMTPGLAFFYGGLVRASSVVSMMMMSFGAIGVTTIIWLLYGYSLAFGKSEFGFIGSFEHIGLAKTLHAVVGGNGHHVPMLAFAF